VSDMGVLLLVTLACSIIGGAFWQRRDLPL
jgi:hypothetical protein